MISLVLTDGKRSWKLEGEDFAPDAEGPHSFGETPALKTETAGTLKTSFELRAKNELVSAGEFEIPLRSDWQWSVDFLIGANIRYQNCFGCLGQKAFPLADNFRAVANDSVYVVWGGNSIKHPVIY